MNAGATPPPPPGSVPPGAHQYGAGPATPAGESRKKSPLGWILGGCGCLALAVIVLFSGCAAILGSGSGDAEETSPAQTAEEAPIDEQEEPAEDAAADGDAPADEATQEAPEEDSPAEEEPTDEATSDEAPAQEATETPGIGTPVAADEMELTVAGVETGLSTIGDPIWDSQANGEFVVVDFTITNNGTAPETVFSNDFMLLNDDGAEFATSSEAWHVEDHLSFEEINPGNSFTGTLIYDVPPGTAVSTLQFSSGWLSEPAEISLAG